MFLYLLSIATFGQVFDVNGRCHYTLINLKNIATLLITDNYLYQGLNYE